VFTKISTFSNPSPRFVHNLPKFYIANCVSHHFQFFYNHALEKAKMTNRNDLLITRRKQETKEMDGRLCLVADYNESEAENLKKSVRVFYRNLLEDPLIKDRIDYLGAPLPSMTPQAPI
jgi:hypothetical protein